MVKRAPLLATCFLSVCAASCSETAQHIAHNIILPEQRALVIRDPAQLPPAPLPSIPPPNTVSSPQPGPQEVPLSLDEAIRVALVNAKIVRVLAGLAVNPSGRTIFDAAITN